MTNREYHLFENFGEEFEVFQYKKEDPSKDTYYIEINSEEVNKGQVFTWLQAMEFLYDYYGC